MPVNGSYTGDIDDMPGKLYDMTKSLMNRINVELRTRFAVRWLDGCCPRARHRLRCSNSR